MSKLRLFAAAFALAAAAPALAAAPAAAPASAELDGSWDTKYGMVFQAFNPLQNAAFLGAYDAGTATAGSIGLQYTLAPNRAVRGFVSLGRASSSFEVAESKDAQTGVVSKTFTNPTLPCNVEFDSGTSFLCTSIYDLNAGAAYLVRLSSSALAPYYGAGATLTFKRERADWKNDTVAGATQVFDGSAYTFGLGIGGQLGLEWRVHKSFSLFAEYGARISLVDYTSNRGKHTVAGAGEELTYSRATYFNLATGLYQGATLGLVAFF